MKRNVKETAVIIALFIIGFTLLILGSVYYQKLQIAANRLQFSELDIYRVVLAFIFFLIGTLVEWRKVIGIFTGGRQVNYPFFIIALILVIIPMIPYVTMVNMIHTIPYSGILILTFESAYTRSALSMLGGIFLVRSLYRSM